MEFDFTKVLAEEIEAEKASQEAEPAAGESIAKSEVESMIKSAVEQAKAEMQAQLDEAEKKRQNAQVTTGTAPAAPEDKATNNTEE